MRPELTITVRSEDGISWWRATARNGRVVCVSETFDGSEHRRVARRAAETMAKRLACSTVVVDG